MATNNNNKPETYTHTLTFEAAEADEEHNFIWNRFNQYQINWFLRWQINQLLNRTSLSQKPRAQHTNLWITTEKKQAKVNEKKNSTKKNYKTKQNELLCIDYYVLENKIHLRSFLLKNTKNSLGFLFHSISNPGR